VPPTITSRPPPATQRRHLGRRERRGIDVLPHEAVQGRPGLEPVGEVIGGQRGDRGRSACRARQELELADDLRRVLGQHAHHELRLVVERDGDLGLGHHPVAADELDLHAAPERGWLRVQDVGLARARGELDRGPEAGLGVHTPSDPELTRDRGSGVLDVDGDREPRALADVALEQAARRHREAVVGGDHRRGEQSREDEDRGGERDGQPHGTRGSGQGHAGSSVWFR
jgi:hypothetical protein